MALNPLGVVRSPTARGLGEIIAGASLPGPGKRYTGDQWGLNRSPWAHPVLSGAAGKRFDADSLRRNALEAVAINGGLDPAEVELMPLDELLVLPDVREAFAGGVIGVTRWPTPAPALFDDVSYKYEVLQTGGAVGTSIVVPDETAINKQYNSVTSIPGGVLLDAVTVTCGGGGAGMHRNTVVLSGYGTLMDLMTDGSNGAGLVSFTLPIGQVIDSPRTLTLMMRDVAELAFDSGSLSATAVYRNIRRV